MKFPGGEGEVAKGKEIEPSQVRFRSVLHYGQVQDGKSFPESSLRMDLSEP